MKIIVIGQAHASSGFIRYTCDALSRHAEVVLIDFWPEKWRRWWLYMLSLRFNREKMYTYRMHEMLYSCAAWRRNTRIVERKLIKIYTPGDKIVHMSNLYSPIRTHCEYEYYIYLQYNIALSVRDECTPWKPRCEDCVPFMELERRLFQEAKHVFSCSNMLVDSFVTDYEVPSTKITDVSGGVDEFFIRNKPERIQVNRNTCLFVGWDFDLKGGRDVIVGFKKARKVNTELKLYVLGPEADSAMESDGIFFVGPVKDRSVLLEYYRKADLFIMPSLRDSYGFVFLEAMSQYVPCIGSDYNAMPEIIGDTGYVVPRGDGEAVGKKIIEYFSDEDKMMQMKRNARKRVEENYTWGRTAQLMWERMTGDYVK